MNRFILVVALAAACSSPAFAGSGKVRANHAYNAYPTPSWVLPLPRSQRLANALGGWNRGYVYMGGAMLAVQYAGAVHSSKLAHRERGVVVSGFFGERLPPMRLRG